MCCDPTTTPGWGRQLHTLLRTAGDDVTAWFAQLATVDPDGLPSNRTVVVRHILPSSGHLVIATDLRSRKIAHLRALPRGALCWYLSEGRQQFRILGHVAIMGPEAEDPKARSLRQKIWQSLGERTQATFLGPAPGSPRNACNADLDAPAAAQDDLPPANFALLVLAPTTVDHLDLNPKPHRRVLYHRRSDGSWDDTPVHP